MKKTTISVHNTTTLIQSNATLD